MIIYPIPDRQFTRIERICARYGAVGICPACGKISYFKRFSDNHREFGYCAYCGSSNRKRQVCLILRKYLNIQCTGPITTDKHIWCTESSGALHNALKHNENYISSEYFGTSNKSGDKVGETLHIDLLETGFPDSTFDVILTCDVLEHIPDPYRALREIYRILKTGGAHIFTVPFYQTRHCDEKRAEIIGKDLIHHMEPLYHLDPHNPNGILVYRIFSMEMLIRLAKIGFHTILHKLYDWKYGIFGNNGLVFESRKV